MDESSDKKTLTLVDADDEASRSALVAKTLQEMREKDQFEILRKWRDELKPSYGPAGDLLFSMERSAVPLLGIVSYGIHMVAYTHPEPNGEPKIWILKHSEHVKA